jgi:hypothetical protein
VLWKVETLKGEFPYLYNIIVLCAHLYFLIVFIHPCFLLALAFLIIWLPHPHPASCF